MVELIESTIVSNAYGQRGAVEYQLRDDNDLRTALEVLHNPVRYKALLAKP